ncbi:hypothetical protein LPJ59_000986 [Coemansia sp. RSA 2399]|nr:hypothetical protein LPJ59_000986 [Coemansia sp. RSA 2399]
MDSDRSTNDNQHKTAGPAQNSPAHKSTHQHPWDAILDRTPSVFCSTRTTPRETVSENECNDIRHTASQCTTMDTTTEPSPTAGSSYNVPTHVPMTDSMEDEIATQGLFDGLDELYNFGDAQPDSYLQFANNPANTADDTHRKSDKRDRLSAMDKECLADMSDDAANKIIATMGGFSAVRSGTTIACKGINGNKTEELTDMSDMEAQCIIGDLGGFAKPRILSAKDSSASVASEHKLAEHEPNKMTRQLPPYPSTPSTATVAGYMGSGVDESAGQKTQRSRDNMPMEILSVTSESARGYVFPLGVAGQFWGASEARQTLVARGCIPSVITETWVRNHYRWSVWSAASYARRFPTRWKEFWSVEAILNRMLYRYEREYTRGGRSALRMIFEGDASAKQLMVLCVASICAKEGSFGVEVTDGWYSIRSSIDPILAQAIRNGRLREGDKIACAGLRVEGLSEGIPPLSGKAGDALLFITGNSVRRARWHAKLGFQYKRTMFMSLSGIYELGGPVGATIDVIIVRSYPMLYMEMTTGGQKVIRTEKEELKVALVFEEKKAALLQSLLGRRRQNEECARRSSSAASSVKILDASCMDGEILYNSIISTNAEPADAQNMLSDDQREALERYIVLKQDEDQAAVNEAVEKTMPSRQVHALFKLSLCDYPTHTYKSVETNASRTAVVTMWRPQNMTPSDFKEGSRV